MGRVVITHSTYIKGIIPWLKELARVEGIKTVTPASINRVKGRSEALQIKVTTPIKGGFKLIARLASSMQEIFVVTELDKKTLIEKINSSRPK